jgi:hypothetical protein
VCYVLCQSVCFLLLAATAAAAALKLANDYFFYGITD